MKRTMAKYLIAFVALLLAGCGYRIYGKQDMPFTEIRIAAVENRTVEPKLQDKLNAALVEEFSKRGIAVHSGASLSLRCVIRDFAITTFAEKSGISVEYRIFMNADFIITDAEGKTKEMKKIDSPFFVTFSGAEDLALLLARKDLAEERGLRELAERVVGELIYR